MRNPNFATFHKGTAILGGLILGLALFVLVSPAQAHRLLVFAFAEGGTIHTESKFVGSGPVQKGAVQVQERQSGRVLLTGVTDEKGKFSFAVPAGAADQRLDLLIVVEAGMGHQGEWLLKAEKYLPGGGTAAASPAPAVPKPAAPGPAVAAPVLGAGLDQQALEAALDKSLERHLAPLKEMLTELSVRRTSLADIIGGLGYLAGIFGVAAYFMSKKKPNA